MNTKSITLHGYSPSQVMLGYEPQVHHFDTEPAPIPMPEDFEEGVPAHQLQIFQALRDEHKLLASEANSYSHYTQVRDQRTKDLVIVRNHAV